jgi:flagellar biosynthesis protein FlhB
VSDPSRTHEATPKRARDFRKRGEIALSREVVGAASLLGAVIALLAGSGQALSALTEFTRKAALAADGREASWVSSTAFDSFITVVGPPLGVAFLASIVAICLQLGWPPALKSVGFDLSKMSPMTNLASAFGLGAAAQRTGTTLAKIIVIGGVVTMALKAGLVPNAIEASELGMVAYRVIKSALLLVVGAIVGISAVDYWLARRRIKTKMMMSTEELKRENKESEGDPMVKGRRRQLAREMAKRRIAVTVPTADVIVVNPTHYAVALRYDEASDRAPVVVAKGMDEVAAKIREIARSSGIPVLSRPPLARALHKHVKEGRPVPANLYRAVAEVLAYVYRLRAGNR